MRQKFAGCYKYKKITSEPAELLGDFLAWVANPSLFGTAETNAG